MFGLWGLSVDSLKLLNKLLQKPMSHWNSITRMQGEKDHSLTNACHNLMEKISKIIPIYTLDDFRGQVLPTGITNNL